MSPVKKDVENYCEMCGARINGSSYSVKFEGSTITVCRNCYEKIRKHATLVPNQAKQSPHRTKTVKPRIEEVELDVDPSYPNIIREARERLKLTTKGLAERMKVQENVIKRIEQGKLKPTVEEARQLEKILGIKLIVTVTSGKGSTPTNEDQSLTLGDIIKIREGKK
ncbi:TIGR00270 family protein [Metallosphaera tengchongensis]|uniref:TIGR00270 family protein n=1 Tax=Metallosphaera tengchongensis TaxID=1532350 RepID=A0A6N0NXM6_9CREN|nr:multiprotein bridging factor aMBF1 [Metallosphaera tengchongensis]QKQ99869.1 TIGR00270 family protein [Metallosphaera tengchongensis]